jgi:drug/metabolite transporter (DMT)-like permease
LTPAPAADAGARPPLRSTPRRQGTLALVTVVVAWGLTWPVSKTLLADVSPLWLLALRSAIAAATLFGVAVARGRLARPPGRDLPVLLSISALHMVGFTVLAFWGLQTVPAGRSVVLAYTTPLWVVPGPASSCASPSRRGAPPGWPSGSWGS